LKSGALTSFPFLILDLSALDAEAIPEIEPGPFGARWTVADIGLPALLFGALVAVFFMHLNVQSATGGYLLSNNISFLGKYICLNLFESIYICHQKSRLSDQSFWL